MQLKYALKRQQMDMKKQCGIYENDVSYEQAEMK